MSKIEKFINAVDVVFNCIPGLNIFISGGQLLYKMARKVDKTANPVKNTTWKDDVKIHVINKSKLECLIGMIPLLGNLTKLVDFMLNGVRDQLMHSVVNNKIEAVKLYLARHPLEDNVRGKRILTQAAYCSKPEVFKLIFESSSWGIHSVLEALKSCWHPNESQEKNANLLLDYYENHCNHFQLDADHTHGITGLLNDFVKANRLDTANRILNILPHCDFARFEKILATYSYRSYNSFRSTEGVLTKDQIEGIINRCKSPTLKELTEYCLKVQNEANGLNQDIHLKNRFNKKFHSDEEKLDNQKIMSEFYVIHQGIIQQLLDRAKESENPSLLIESLSRLANKGEVKFLEMFLEKYEKQLTPENKLSIFKNIHLSFSEKELTLKGFEYLFKRYGHDLTDEQCMTLLNRFSDSFSANILLVEKVIEIRPGLMANYRSQIDDIKIKIHEIKEESKIN